ncbi:BglG family transcription antiterminator [Romboutsia sedimentorum]|uniref:BglG family transcription antiterminator n=1 Tax=Romboutsia sedimentorum TaxID=1368474 RepID=A0ABT7E659_9FIRM|nr:BglG family transcription antiterminator [Romboutsia sedimentorum]MDK2562415.1 BglG family transcription antiterminator [Romboutsia sedimentorum]
MVINNRQQEILEILFNKKDVITSDKLCSAINVSSRTVRNDIKEINKTFKDKGINISSQKGKGYRLNIEDIELFNKLIKKKVNNLESDYLTKEERYNFIIFILLKNNLENTEYITQIELADSLYISISSLKNDLKIVKEKLEKYKLSIAKVSNKGIMLDGEEEYIRYYINKQLQKSQLFKQTFNSIYQNKVSSISKDDISIIIRENIIKFKLRLTDVSYKNLMNCIQICILRKLYNKKIQYQREYMDKIKNESSSYISEKICSDIKDRFDILLIESDIVFITKHILSSNTIVKSKYEILSMLNTQDLMNYKLVEEIINAIDINFGVNLDSDDILKDFLVSHIKGAINRAKYNIKVENEMLNNIKSNYPFSFGMGILANDIIKKNIGIRLCEDDVGFLSLHLEASMRRLEINKERKVKKVIIICSTGAGTSLLLKVKLQKQFGNQLIIVDTIPWYEFDEKLLSVLDFVISTMKLDSINKDRIVYVKNLLDEEEIQNIKSKINDVQSSEISLDKRFKEDLFFMNSNITNKSEAIKFMTDKLVDRGYINSEIQREFFKREEISSTEIGDLVAIPHTMHSDIKESFICVLILKKSILWDKKQVQIVILIGMANHEQKEWKLSLEKLYRNIVDIQTTTKLIKSSDFNDFINYIKYII